jgi:Ku70/Ku80 beta-barrel domain
MRAASSVCSVAKRERKVNTECMRQCGRDVRVAHAHRRQHIAEYRPPYPKALRHMPAPRAYWKGFLRLSLVSIGVHLHNAVESKAAISFRQIHKPSGRRVNYEKVVQGVGRVENADIAKGYEVDADTYVLLEPEERRSGKGQGLGKRPGAGRKDTVAKRVDDDDVMHLLKIMLKANGRYGVPQGGVISPLLTTVLESFLYFDHTRSRKSRKPLCYRRPNSGLRQTRSPCQVQVLPPF